MNTTERDELEAWKKIALGRGKLLYAYRVGIQRTGNALEQIDEGQATLRRLGVNPDTGKRLEGQPPTVRYEG